MEIPFLFFVHLILPSITKLIKKISNEHIPFFALQRRWPRALLNQIRRVLTQLLPLIALRPPSIHTLWMFKSNVDNRLCPQSQWRGSWLGCSQSASWIRDVDGESKKKIVSWTSS